MKLPTHPAIVAMAVLGCGGCDSGSHAESKASAEVPSSHSGPAIPLTGLLRSSPELSRDDLLEEFKDMVFSNEQEVRAAIDVAARAPGVSISYLHLAWSVESQARQAEFADFALAWHGLHPESPVEFHFLDCSLITSDYSPLHELSGWQRDKHVVGGFGEILWMKEGRVIDFGKIGDFSSIDALIAKAESLVEISQGEKEVLRGFNR